MRHNKTIPKLNRTAEHRKALLRNLLTCLIREKKIKTTRTKAKALKAFADKFLARVKTADLTAKRKAFSVLTDKDAGKELFANIIPNLGEKKSGFIKIYHLGQRKGDAANISLVKIILAGEEKTEKAPKVAKALKKEKTTAKKEKKETEKKPAKPSKKAEKAEAPQEVKAAEEKPEKE